VIAHPPQLDAALGTILWEPVCSVTFYAPDGSALLSQAVTDGELVASAGRWPRETVDVVLPTALTPGATTPPVSPYGGTVQLFMGARIMGTSYVFLRATLDVYETVVARPDGTITVRAVSHEARVNEDRYWSRDVTQAGKASAVVTGIVRRTLGSTHPVRNLLSTDVDLAAGAFPLDGDVWPTVEAIMDATGGEAVFGPNGELILRDVPTKTTPALTLRVGDATTSGGTITGYESTRGWAYNSVAVVYMEEGLSGQAVNRVVGRWQDTSSSTGVGTAYGRHVRRDTVLVPAGKLPSQAAADKAAASIARRAQGRYRNVVLRHQPAPWLDGGDTVRAVLLGGTTEDLLVETVRVPLSQLDVQQTDTRDYAYTGSN
jgi:hypothetical protein